MLGRLRYLRRVLSAYTAPGQSQLSFWHEKPEANPRAAAGKLGEYYMTFSSKADYAGPLDEQGVPQLDYRGALGLHYNPIAVAQYGLGNFNRFLQTGDESRRRKYLLAAEWLISRLEKNGAGLDVWMHHFDFEYRTPLRAPWYSGLAQGQGISLLARAHLETGKEEYLEAGRRAFASFTRTVEDGGVLVRDGDGRIWIEEYIVSPPTHILNGFIWAAWGVYDYFLMTGAPEAQRLWEQTVSTLKQALSTYDAGFWSLYEHSGTKMRMLASSFYHALHIVQLRILHEMTGEPVFRTTADLWESYRARALNRLRAWVHKAVFKLCYY